MPRRREEQAAAAREACGRKFRLKTAPIPLIEPVMTADQPEPPDAWSRSRQIHGPTCHRVGPSDQRPTAGTGPAGSPACLVRRLRFSGLTRGPTTGSDVVRPCRPPSEVPVALGHPREVLSHDVPHPETTVADQSRPPPVRGCRKRRSPMHGPNWSRMI